MPNFDIDTTDAQYVELLDAVQTLRPMIAARLKLFVRLPRTKQRQWLQRDPLLRAVLRLVRAVNKSDALASEVDD